VYRLLGLLVEPFRDELVRRVVGGALRHSVRGHSDDGALARLTHQVEIVRDTYAGLIVVLRGFLVTIIGVVIGLLSISPIIALRCCRRSCSASASPGTLGMASDRYRAAVRADEQAAIAAGAVLAGILTWWRAAPRSTRGGWWPCRSRRRPPRSGRSPGSPWRAPAASPSAAGCR